MLQRIALALALFLGAAGSAHGAVHSNYPLSYSSSRPRIGFLLDLVAGLSAPISDGYYKSIADPSFKMGARFGVMFDVAPKLIIGPEFDLDFIPINSNDYTFNPANLDVRLYRVRALIGPRFVIPVVFGDIYFRMAFGIDHIGGTASTGGGGIVVTQDLSTTGFTFEPGFGVDFNLTRNMVFGISTGFPIALHNFNATGWRSFTAVDSDLLATIGFRF